MKIRLFEIREYLLLLDRCQVGVVGPEDRDPLLCGRLCETVVIESQVEELSLQEVFVPLGVVLCLEAQKLSGVGGKNICLTEQAVEEDSFFLF